MEWRSADPWWVKGVTIHMLDVLFGKPKYAERTLREGPIAIELDGRTYPGTCRMAVAEWKRLRGFTRRILRAHVEIPDGIPFPGKGEM